MLDRNLMRLKNRMFIKKESYKKVQKWALRFFSL